MRFAYLFNKATHISELKKIYLSIAVAALFLLTLIFYLNYQSLKNQKIQDIDKQAEVINSALKNSFDSYKEMFEVISRRINNSALDTEKVSKLLK